MFRKIIIAFFLLILISPAIGWVAGIDVELEENRILAKAPFFSVQRLYNRRFFYDFERYFNDHFAYRAMLVRMKNWTDYYVFKTSPSPKVHLGKDGWLYYFRTNRGYFKIDDCIPGERKRMRLIAKQLHELERIVETSGRTFLFVVAPDKSTIYPEYFGMKRPESGCHKSRYDLFREALREYPVKNFVRLDQLLLEAKERQQVYYKTDTHWNLYGSMIASEAIVRHLAPTAWRRYFPEVMMSDQSYRGDLSQMMALNISENTWVIDNIIYNAEVKEINLGRFMNGERFRFNTMLHSGKHLLPGAVIYRDSFATRMLPFLKGSFEHLDVIWSNNVTTRLTPAPVEDLKAARIVIVEISEMYLPGLTIDLRTWYEGLHEA